MAPQRAPTRAKATSSSALHAYQASWTVSAECAGVAGSGPASVSFADTGRPGLCFGWPRRAVAARDAGGRRGLDRLVTLMLRASCLGLAKLLPALLLRQHGGTDAA